MHEPCCCNMIICHSFAWFPPIWSRPVHICQPELLSYQEFCVCTQFPRPLDQLVPCPLHRRHPLLHSCLQFGGAFFTRGLDRVFPVAPQLTSLHVRGYNTVRKSISFVRSSLRASKKMDGGVTIWLEKCESKP